MVDPVTIGTLAASALGIAAESMLKAGVGETVKDAYAALKYKIAKWAQNDVEALEKSPRSPARNAVVAELVDALGADDALAVRDLARK